MLFTTTRQCRRHLRSLLIALPLLLLWNGQSAADPLGSYNVDLNRISVSGLSSGGFMAQQFHVTYSNSLMGAGIFAGGPYYCAQGSLANALNVCMQTYMGVPPVSQLINITHNEASSGNIADTGNMATDRVYLFSGTQDTTVTPPVMDALRDYYAQFVDAGNLVYVDSMPAEHAMITDNYGNACGYHGTPFINDCNYDAAGVLLQHIYGGLNPRTTATGQLITYSQAEFLPNPTAHGLHQNGHLYVPANCADGSTSCSLHVVFHGCKQYEELIGSDYYTKTGYNEWAEANDIIILYPQAKDSSGNPNGCWDWWGYDDANYHRRTGRQMQAVKAMIDRVTSGAPSDNDPPNAPAGLAVSNFVGTTVALSWNANSEPDLSGYNIYADTTTPVALNATTRRNTQRIGGESFSVAGLQPATQYFFTATAVDTSNNESAPSAEVSATTDNLPACVDYTATTYSHVNEDRADVCYFWYACASGSGDLLGLYNIFTTATVRETAPGYFEAGSCE